MIVTTLTLMKTNHNDDGDDITSYVCYVGMLAVVQRKEKETVDRINDVPATLHCSVKCGLSTSEHLLLYSEFFFLIFVIILYYRRDSFSRTVFGFFKFFQKKKNIESFV